VVVCRFTLRRPARKPPSFDILFPAAALRSVEGALATRTEEGCARGAEWRAQLARRWPTCGSRRAPCWRGRSSACPSSCSSRWATSSGQHPGIGAFAGRRPHRRVGSIGEQDGKAALRIERIQNRRNGQ
jgi:hypothetical protein